MELDEQLFDSLYAVVYFPMEELKEEHGEEAQRLCPFDISMSTPNLTREWTSSHTSLARRSTHVWKNWQRRLGLVKDLTKLILTSEAQGIDSCTAYFDSIANFYMFVF
jgi:hypothetical protein